MRGRTERALKENDVENRGDKVENYIKLPWIIFRIRRKGTRESEGPLKKVS